MINNRSTSLKQNPGSISSRSTHRICVPVGGPRPHIKLPEDLGKKFIRVSIMHGIRLKTWRGQRQHPVLAIVKVEESNGEVWSLSCSSKPWTEGLWVPFEQQNPCAQYHFSCIRNSSVLAKAGPWFFTEDKGWSGAEIAQVYWANCVVWMTNPDKGSCTSPLEPRSWINPRCSILSYRI